MGNNQSKFIEDGSRANAPQSSSAAAAAEPAPLQFKTFSAPYEAFDKLRIEADKLQAEKKYREAVTVFQQALAIAQAFPSDEIIKKELKKSRDTRSIMKIMKEIPSVIASVEAVAANCLVQLNRFDEARPLLDSALKRAPQDWNTHLCFMEYLKKSAKYSELREHLLRLVYSGKTDDIKSKAAFEVLRLHVDNPQLKPLNIGELKDIGNKYDRNNPHACQMLAKFYYEAGDCQEAIKKYRRALSLFDFDDHMNKAITYSNLGHVQASDQNPNQDKEAALQNFLVAVELNHAPAIFPAAVLLDRYDAGTEQKKQAIELYSRGAEKADINSMYNYAYKLAYGEDLPQNLEKAASFFTKVIDACKELTAETITPDILHSYQGASVELGRYYQSINNFSEAEEYYKLSLKLGYKEALNALINLYCTQHRYAEYFATNMQLLKESPNSTIALFNIGMAYFFGNGTEKNVAKGIEYFISAAKLGCTPALLELAEIYLQQAQETLITKERLAEITQNYRENVDEEVYGKLHRFISKDSEVTRQALAQCIGRYRHTQGEIQTIFQDDSVPAASRIQQLFNLINEAATLDEINVSTCLLKISQLLQRLPWIQKDLLEKVLTKFKEIITKLSKQFPDFSAASLCNLWRSMSSLNISMDHPEIQDILSLLIRQTIDKNKRDLFSIQDKAYIFSRMTQLLPCSNQLFTKFYRLLLEDCLTNHKDLAGYELSLLLQSIAIADIDKAAQGNRDIPSEITENLQALIKQVIALQHTDLRTMQQAFIGLRYFSRYPQFKSDESTLDTLRQALETHRPENANLSALQTRVTIVAQAIDPNLKTEHPIQTLPVDIVLSNGLPIQVHGPSHYLLTSGVEYGADNCVLKSKDQLLAHIIKSACEKPLVVIPFFEVAGKTNPELRKYIEGKLGIQNKSAASNRHAFHGAAAAATPGRGAEHKPRPPRGP